MVAKGLTKDDDYTIKLTQYEKHQAKTEAFTNAVNAEVAKQLTSIQASGSVPNEIGNEDSAFAD